MLLRHELEALRRIPGPDHQARTLSVLWPVAEGPEGLEKAVNRLCADAEKAVDDSTRLLVLSDEGVDHERAAIPMLLAVGAVHHHLTRAGKRMRCSLIAETGEARDVHQVACLISYGASAVCPSHRRRWPRVDSTT